MTIAADRIERLRSELVSALALRGSTAEWPTLEAAVADAAKIIQADRKAIHELHEILGTGPHQCVVEKAREVVSALNIASLALDGGVCDRPGYRDPVCLARPLVRKALGRENG